MLLLEREQKDMHMDMHMHEMHALTSKDIVNEQRCV